MYCKNCGSNIDGMIFCTNCGAKVEVEFTDVESSMVTQYSSSTTESSKYLKIMGYILAFWPLVGLISLCIPDNIYDVISPGITGATIGLWIADMMLLKKCGYTGKWVWWGFFFLPVYLFFRSKKLKDNYSKFAISLVITLFGFLVALLMIYSALTEDIVYSNTADYATQNKNYAQDTFYILYPRTSSDLVINKITEEWGYLKCGECTYYEFDSYSENSTEKNLFHNVMIIRTSDKAISWFLYSDDGFSTYRMKDNLDLDSHYEKHGS